MDKINFYMNKFFNVILIFVFASFMTFSSSWVLAQEEKSELERLTEELQKLKEEDPKIFEEVSKDLEDHPDLLEGITTGDNQGELEDVDYEELGEGPTLTETDKKKIAENIEGASSDVKAALEKAGFNIELYKEGIIKGDGKLIEEAFKGIDGEEMQNIADSVEKLTGIEGDKELKEKFLREMIQSHQGEFDTRQDFGQSGGMGEYLRETGYLGPPVEIGREGGGYAPSPKEMEAAFKELQELGIEITSPESERGFFDGRGEGRGDGRGGIFEGHDMPEISKEDQEKLEKAFAENDHETIKEFMDKQMDKELERLTEGKSEKEKEAIRAEVERAKETMDREFKEAAERGFTHEFNEREYSRPESFREIEYSHEASHEFDRPEASREWSREAPTIEREWSREVSAPEREAREISVPEREAREISVPEREMMERYRDYAPREAPEYEGHLYEPPQQ